MRDACPHCGQEMEAAVIDGDGCIRLTMQFTPPFRTQIPTASGPPTVEVNSEFRRNVITGEIVRAPATPAKCRLAADGISRFAASAPRTRFWQ
jgi:hypothetical protein